MNLRNNRGQGLIEYLIIVALVAVAGISVMKVIGQNIQGQFARVASAIQGQKSSVKMEEITESHYQKKDMSDFFKGAANRADKNEK